MAASGDVPLLAARHLVEEAAAAAEAQGHPGHPEVAVGAALSERADRGISAASSPESPLGEVPSLPSSIVAPLRGYVLVGSFDGFLIFFDSDGSHPTRMRDSDDRWPSMVPMIRDC